MCIDATSGLATENERSYNCNYSLYVFVEKIHFNVAYNFYIR